MTDQELIEAMALAYYAATNANSIVRAWNIEERNSYLIIAAILFAAIQPEFKRLAAVTAERDRLREALSWFLDDPRFVVTVGGNPYAVEAMLDTARAALDSERG